MGKNKRKNNTDSLHTEKKMPSEPILFFFSSLLFAFIESVWVRFVCECVCMCDFQSLFHYGFRHNIEKIERQSVQWMRMLYTYFCVLSVRLWSISKLCGLINQRVSGVCYLKFRYCSTENLLRKISAFIFVFLFVCIRMVDILSTHAHTPIPLDKVKMKSITSINHK